ncbi:MAG: lipid-binding SYLF domain-containing protein [Bacteroidota bacterium]
MKVFKISGAVLLMAFLFSCASKNTLAENSELIADVKEGKKALLEADPGLNDLFKSSAGYVIFPNVGKGGLIVGGASGNGILYNASGEALGRVALKKLNIGLQAGAQSVIEAIFFEDNNALSNFKEGNFEFGAEASAVAIKSGVAANAEYKNGVAVVALPKAGLMADASVGGQKFKFVPFK